MIAPEHFKHKTAFIKSMQELAKRYEQAIKRGISKSDLEKEKKENCLLCNPIGGWYRQTDMCGEHRERCTELGCPWIVITGGTCDDEYQNSKDLYEAIYFSTDEKRQQARINQLKEWIKIYKGHKVEK